MKNIFNQKGVSLLQVLFISAILGGLALIGTNIITSEKAAQKGAQNKDDIEILHQAVTNLLQDKKHCTGTLINSALSGPWKTTATEIPAIYIAQTDPSAGGGQAYTAFLTRADVDKNPRYMNGNIYVKSIRVDYPNKKFAIDYAKVNTKSTSAAMITKFVDKITFKTEGTVDTCYADSEGVNNQTAKEFCESLGQLFVWDDTIKDCALADHRCPNPNEIFVGIRSDGASVCKALGQYTDWNNLIDNSTPCNPTAPNTLASLEYVGGKIKLKCTSAGP